MTFQFATCEFNRHCIWRKRVFKNHLPSMMHTSSFPVDSHRVVPPVINWCIPPLSIDIYIYINNYIYIYLLLFTINSSYWMCVHQQLSDSDLLGTTCSSPVVNIWQVPRGQSQSWSARAVGLSLVNNCDYEWLYK